MHRLDGHTWLMPKLGVRDDEPLVVDLHDVDRLVGGPLAGPCGLPEWFGRNLDAWNYALGTEAISPVVDAHPFLIVRVLVS